MLSLTIPNIITLIRLALGGVFLMLLVSQYVRTAMAVFAVAWALDAVDGFLARRLHQETASGYILDKIVDRLLLLGGGAALLWLGYVPALTWLIFLKDIIALPAALLQYSRGQKIADLGIAGKVLTLLQGIALLWLVIIQSYARPIIMSVAVMGSIVALWYLYQIIRAGSHVGEKSNN